MSRKTSARKAPILLFFLGFAAWSLAQEEPANLVPAREGDTVNWHGVVAGETLSGITEHYLGVSDLWKENWRLNPWVEDPNHLLPGLRLRIITKRLTPARQARLVKSEGHVLKKPPPTDWLTAYIGDRLARSYGVRTLAQSSAQLLFDNGTQLQLTQDSLVFLRESEQDLRGVKRDSIEVVDGQVDLMARSAGPRHKSDQLEILIGETTAKPAPGAGGVSETRFRKTTQGESKLMIYRGAGQLSAGGSDMTLNPGTGTSVSKEGKAAPPEKLLPAPDLQGPGADVMLDVGEASFSWLGVNGAQSYKLEVYREPKCASLVMARAVEAGQAARLDDLPAGEYYWRVRAVSGSGLDGFAPPARRLVVRWPGPDSSPPVVILLARGGWTFQESGSIELEQGAELRLEAQDDASGVLEVDYRWDNGSWVRWEKETIGLPASGQGVLEFKATDFKGNASRVWSVRVQGRPAASFK